jgi:predicted O-methyltransferase YrrM
MKLFFFYMSYFQRWLKYYFRARTCHDVHSPFVSRLIREVIENKKHYYTFFSAERLRHKLLFNSAKIAVTDYGAGSMVTTDKQRSIKDIAKYAAISPKQGQQLFHLVRIAKPKSILEMGTSLGISAVYQAGAAPNATFISLEGCPNTARLAQNNLRSLGLNQITVLDGPFKDNLPIALAQLGVNTVFFFLDGDHQEGSTLAYYQQCLPFIHNDSVFVLADIHWSESMEKAWNSLKSREEVTISIDLFHFGILFFRKEHRVKQDFTLIAYPSKPWRLGFFQ